MQKGIIFKKRLKTVRSLVTALTNSYGNKIVIKQVQYNHSYNIITINHPYHTSTIESQL